MIGSQATNSPWASPRQPRLIHYAILGTRDYDEAWRLQEHYHELRSIQAIGDILLILEHPPTYTLGKHGRRENIILSDAELEQRSIAWHRTDRGGDVTGHNPGQLVVYPILDLGDYGLSVPAYVFELEEVVIGTLRALGITATRQAAYRGVWVGREKIASIGVRISRQVTMHGLALNVSNDLDFFNDIVPCGIQDCRMTSIQRLRDAAVPMESVIRHLLWHFHRRFGALVRPVETVRVSYDSPGTT